MELTKWKEGRVDHGFGRPGLILIGGDERLLSVCKNENYIIFREECDGYFNEYFSKEEALQVVDELRQWILES